MYYIYLYGVWLCGNLSFITLGNFYAVRYYISFLKKASGKCYPKTIPEEIDFQEPFFAVINWPISEFYGASVCTCIMHYFDQSATNQLDNVFVIVGFCRF